MGMFFNKLMAESAVEDVVQTPDDIGVDLDEIEKAIAGEDGIEAHRDEVEDAAEGMIGDPVEECAMIMYESEYNMNSIMKTIGMAELHEAQNGRDFVLEASSENANGFFAKVREVIASMFKRITELFYKVMGKLETSFNRDKALITKYTADIQKGSKDPEVLKDKKFYTVAAIKYAPAKSNIMDSFNKDIDAIASTGNADADLTVNKITHVDVCNEEMKAITGANLSIQPADEATAAKAMNDKLNAYLNERKEGNAPTYEEVIQTLATKADIADIKASYKAVKDAYNVTFKELKEWEKVFSSKAVKKADIDAEAKKINDAMFSVVLKYITLAKYQKNVQHRVFVTTLTAAKLRRDQARHIALAWKAAGSKAAKAEKKSEAKNESAMFNIDII